MAVLADGMTVLADGMTVLADGKHWFTTSFLQPLPI